jgi:YbbR domain-containing protein
MKKSVWLFVLIAVLLILALFTNISAENPLSQGLPDLLFGKTTVTSGGVIQPG